MISSLSNRSLYSSLDDTVYLNQASLGLISQTVVLAMHEFLDDVARHGNINLTDAEEVGLFTPLREKAARLMNCPLECLAIVSSAGEMLGHLPHLLQPINGNKIVTIATDFPAITRPWIAYSETHDIDMVFVDEDSDRDLTELLIENIDETTAVVAVSYVQFSTGSRVDVKRLREFTEEMGAYLVIDVTQAAGAIPVDTKSWRADIVVCSGYKWLGGHGGVGLAVVSPDILQQTPTAPGWMGAIDPFDMQATRLPLANDARRFTQSTMSYISIIGLACAIDELLALGIENIDTHAVRLAKVFHRKLASTNWTMFRPITDKSSSSHIITLQSNKADIQSTLNSFRRANIVCSNRNGRIRVSIAHFNNENDIQTLTDNLT